MTVGTRRAIGDVVNSATVRRRRDARWETRFGRWVARRGVGNILGELRSEHGLRITSQCVYAWLRGTRTPRPPCAEALVKLSQGRLTLGAIYGHAAELRARRGASASH